MKKFFRSLIVIAAAAALVSFQVGDSPQEVAVKFAKAMLVANFDSARMYVASNSSSLSIFDFNRESDKNGVQFPDSLKQIFAQATVKSTGDTTINDSTVTVGITITLPKPILGQQETENTLVLVKENGIWKVDMGMPAYEQTLPMDSLGVYYSSGIKADSTATQ